MDLHSYPKLKNVSDNSLVTIDRSKFSIGRSLSCNYILGINEVSRVHCIFELHSENGNVNWVLRDTSSNGTYVNDTLLKGIISNPLKDGDIIVIGSPKNTYSFHCIEKNSDLTDEELLQITDTIIERLQKPQDILQLYDTVPNKKIKVVDNDHNYVILNTENVTIAEEHPHPSTSRITEVTNLSEPTFNQIPSNDSCVPCSSLNIEESKEKEIVSKESCSSNAVKHDGPSLDDVENELQCSICSELFIKAVTLNCSHSFCKYCIEQWKKNKKICPICRTDITTTAPTIVLDNFIAKVLETADEETKEARKKIIDERDQLTQGTSNKSNIKPNQHQPATSTAGDVILINSDEDETGSSSDLDESYDSDYDYYDDYHYDYSDYSGIPGVYYGGYGRCYSCGQRGHWANGCPTGSRQRR